MAKFYGIGRTFKKGKGGIPARVEDADLIRDSVFQIMGTSPGQRVMRPWFGMRLLDLLFNSQGPVLNALVKREVQRVLKSSEPRLRVLDVVTTVDRETKLNVDVAYEVLGVEDRVSVPVGR